MGISAGNSKIISALRFPLMLLVVLVHSSLTVPDAPEFFPYTLLHAVVEVFTRTAVPLFFLFSGYLFFGNCERLTSDVWGRKLKRRVFSLLVPYVIWNCLAILRFYLTETLCPGMATDAVCVRDFALSDYIRVFWDGYTDGRPLCFPFWFVRDLMVLVLLAPIIDCLLRKAGGLAVLATAALWLSPIQTPPGFSLPGLFFFTLGGFYARTGKGFALRSGFPTVLFAVIFALTAVLSVVCRCSEVLPYGYVSAHLLPKVSLLAGAFLITTWTYCRLERGSGFCDSSLGKFANDGYFFLFAFHPFVLSPLKALLMKFIAPSNGWEAIIVYLVAPALTVILCLAVFYLMRKWLPNLTSLLTGRRS